MRMSVCPCRSTPRPLQNLLCGCVSLPTLFLFDGADSLKNHMVSDPAESLKSRQWKANFLILNTSTTRWIYWKWDPLENEMAHLKGLTHNKFKFKFKCMNMCILKTHSSFWLKKNPHNVNVLKNLNFYR